MPKPEVRSDQIQCDSIQLSGPLQGKTLQVKVDVRPMRERENSRSKNSDYEWESKEKYSGTDRRDRREQASEWGTVGFLFLLLFVLIAAVGNGGVGSSSSPSTVPAYNSFPSN